MRRVLIVDDPRLIPRLTRLRTAIGTPWNLILTTADHLESWSSAPNRNLAETAALLADSHSILPAGEATELFVAATSPEALKAVSLLAFRPGTQVAVLPHALQTADWIFSLYPLSEGDAPRVRGVHEHRSASAVHAFHDQLPPAMPGRHLVATCTLPAAAISEADVEIWLLEDVDLLRFLAGDFKHLIAVAIPDSAGGLRSVTVTLGGDGAGTVTWTLQSGSNFDWRMQSSSTPGLELTRTSEGEFRSGSQPPSDAIASRSPDVPWENVLRAFDDLAALRRSLKRRRLVELQTETISERAQFKSLMSASGCGLLMATLLGAVTLLGVGAALDPRESLQRTSERAGLILRADHFEPGSIELGSEANAEWPSMIRRLSQTPAPILVEQTDETALDAQRRDRLSRDLAAAGIESPGTRVELYRFRGDVFLNLLTLAWIVLFLPLGLFLAVQALLLAAPRSTTVGRIDP